MFANDQLNSCEILTHCCASFQYVTWREHFHTLSMIRYGNNIYEHVWMCCNTSAVICLAVKINITSYQKYENFTKKQISNLNQLWGLKTLMHECLRYNLQVILNLVVNVGVIIISVNYHCQNDETSHWKMYSMTPIVSQQTSTQN